MPEQIPPEYQLKCATCGKVIDLRDLGQVFSHGVYNDYTEKYECLTDPIEVDYSMALKVGDSVAWTKDKKPINLN